jgi:hypothetical protein
MSAWQIGDRVRVLRGPFQGFSGTVTAIQGVLGTVLDEVAVDVEIFDRTTPVLLPPNDLRPDDSSGGGSAGDPEPRAPHPPSGEESSHAELI